jgi:Protein of unknown function (DUF3137)
MQAYHDFRLFYNQNIHPELLHLERRRRRLLRLMLVSGLLILGAVLLQLYIRVFLITLLLLIPIAIWTAYLVFRIQVYYQEFKPRIIMLILDFIDNDVNYHFERDQYKPKDAISKTEFLASKIFTTADDYSGEDLMKGKVREMPFQLCELKVREFSPARDRLDYVFRGTFLIGDYQRWDMRGGVLVLPDAYRKYLSRSERAFHLLGGRRVREKILPEFEVFFDTYATKDVRVDETLSIDMQKSILRFRERFQQTNRQKEIYLSVIDDKIYIALTQDKDRFEPSLLSNTVSFEIAREFYEDIMLLLNIVKEVDVMN